MEDLEQEIIFMEQNIKQLKEDGLDTISFEEELEKLKQLLNDTK